MRIYDHILSLKKKVLLVINTIHIHLLSYRNIDAKGLQNIHRTTEIYGRAGGTVGLGRMVTTGRNCSIVAVGGHVAIGENTYINARCTFVSRNSIKIGKDCMFGPNTCVYDHDHIFTSEEIQDEYKTSPIIIGDNCWIGCNVTILRGSNIGEGSVIGAGTVVSGTIPAHSLVVNERKMDIRILK